jgi:hypothetical protein
MPIPMPRLDDRDWKQLSRDGKARAQEVCPAWSEFHPGDPGVALIEAFAFITDAMLYRLNRVPAKLQIALLNLVGISLRPPAGAGVTLTFTREDEGKGELVIPAGTRVGTTDGVVVFILPSLATIPAGEASVDARALHCELVDGELIGNVSGLSAQHFTVTRGPVIAPTEDHLDFVLGVTPGKVSRGLPTRRSGSQVFDIWREVEDPADLRPGAAAYRLDRGTGTVQLAMGQDEAHLPKGAEVRAWYRRGGGSAGNVAANKLTAIQSGAKGVSVTNAARAAGGADAETVDELIARGPSAVGGTRAAVTPRDYERIVLEVGAVARSRAYAQAQAWRHGDPGVVDVLVMPTIDVAGLPEEAVTAPIVIEHRVEVLRERIADALSRHTPLGVRVNVTWARVRAVSVLARVVIGPEADSVAVASGVRRRLNALFSPLRDLAFGRALRASDAYEAILAEPGVRYADGLSFAVAETPLGAVTDLVRDPAQPNAWFAATEQALHRTLDNGESWSVVSQVDGETPRFVRRHPDRPGLLVLGVARDKSGALHVSRDMGESWERDVAAFNSELFDAAWIERDRRPMLLIATADGLRQFTPGIGSGPAPVVVDKAIDTRGYYAVTSSISPSGVISVSVAARSEGGVYLSSSGGVSETFRRIGLKDKDVRRLAVQETGARSFLWATAGAEAGEAGEGAFRLALRAGGEDDPEGFLPFSAGWQGGSCEAVAFAGTMVYAGSNRSGVLTLDTAAAKPEWKPIRLDGGLPIRDTERLLEVVEAVAVAAREGGDPIVFSGGVRGVYRSMDGGRTYGQVSTTTFIDRIPLPPDWLYCAGEHQIIVVGDLEGGR